MNAVIDTSSLLAFVRYYLPFDTKNKFKNLVKSKFESGEIIILDKIVSESKYIAKGIILTELDFIKETTKEIIKTNSLIPSKKFYNLLDNQFCNKDIIKLKGITETEFELEKTRFLNSPDASLILYALTIKNENPIIITEETKTANDNKIFKKIPEICHSIALESCSIPNLFKDHFKIDLSELLK